MKPLSAIEAVTPAIEHTKGQLFKPFRFWRWARLAVLVLCTGEFAGGGPGNGLNFNLPVNRERNDLAFLASSHEIWAKTIAYLPWVLLGVALLIILFLALIYIASVCRFIIFDSVLHNRCELRLGWRRWQPQGYSYFLWTLGLGFSMLLALLVFIGGPVLIAWQRGVFSQPREHIFLLIVGGLALLFVLIALAIVGAAIGLLAKDFAVPVMALENVGILDAWRRLLPLLSMAKLSYAGYVGMKILLAIGVGILFGIINLIALLILLIPLAIGGVAIYLIAIGIGLEWNLFTITVTVLLGAVAFHLLLAVVCFVSVPPLVFFQSYALHFFGSRYPRLGDLMFPPPAQPETPPLPAPA